MATKPQRHSGPRLTFVLVHGAWHGGWCWRQVADILEGRGHKVYCPTLTGLGERSHLMSREINLYTHIADVVNVFRWENIENAVLCGHSYGGWIISGAVEEVESQVSSLVFLDAHVPQDGQTGRDTANSRKSILLAEKRGEMSRVPPTARDFEVIDKDHEAWIDSKMTPQPLGVSLQPIRLTGARERIRKKTYIRGSRYKSCVFDKNLEDAKRAGWRTFEVQSGHDVMVDAPKRLADILIEVS